VRYACIKPFKQNKLHLGLGAEFAIDDHQAISVEWLRIDTIEENTLLATV